MPVFPERIEKLATALLSAARERKLHVATAESCTGGMIAGALTEIAGSSDVVDRGFVTYSNQAKIDMLGVRQDTLDQSGAVSPETAREMAEGARRASGADLAVAVTGIAGPGGGSAEKPVGLVYIAISATTGGDTRIMKNIFSGDRSSVRLQTVETALRMMLESVAVSAIDR